MIYNHTHSKLPEIQKCVSQKLCEKLAIKTGFVRRSTSRLKGFEFINSMILGQSDDSLSTYTKRITEFSENKKLSLSGLAQRINTEAAEKLMLEILARCLTNTYERGITCLKSIKRILIQDSTCVSLNQKLADIYAGSNGYKKTAGIKIDCIYDYSNESVLHVSHHARTVADAQNGKRILEYLQPQDLVLRDLGYFNIEEFESIDDRGGYFVSRLRVDIKVYLRPLDNEPTDFIGFLKKKMKGKKGLDKTVYIGHRKKKVRLIVSKIPEEAINIKIRKAQRAAATNRTSLSKAKKALLSYTILITNLPPEQATVEEIAILYKIRWRIELLFKEWKSQLKIQNITGTNIHRIRCLIFSRLCLILITNKIVSYLCKISLERYKQELSIKKALDFILKDGGALIFFLSKQKKKRIQEIEKDLHSLLKSTRKSRKTIREHILSSSLAA